MTEDTRIIVKRLLQVVFTLVVEALVLFICAGKIDWLWGWVWTGFNVLFLAMNAFLLPKEVILERGRKKENVKPWDRVFGWLMLPALAGLFIVGGLDFRFGWSPALETGWRAAGLALNLAGAVLLVWSMRTNRFFSTFVRIQKERGHIAVTGGPYRFIRHPGYAGMILTMLGNPLLFGSWWAFLPVVLYVGIVISRTLFEEATLRKELPGYEAYVKQTRYRILPGVW